MFDKKNDDDNDDDALSQTAQYRAILRYVGLRYVPSVFFMDGTCTLFWLFLLLVHIHT